MMLDFSWQSSGMFKGTKIIDTLRGLISEISIEDLPIPYTAVAANVADEKEVWLQSGSLFNLHSRLYLFAAILHTSCHQWRRAD